MIHCTTLQYTILTISFMAPEVYARASTYSGFKADVWSCGVMLFLMLAGAQPFDKADRYSAINLSIVGVLVLILFFCCTYTHAHTHAHAHMSSSSRSHIHPLPMPILMSFLSPTPCPCPCSCPSYPPPPAHAHVLAIPHPLPMPIRMPFLCPPPAHAHAQFLPPLQLRLHPLSRCPHRALGKGIRRC
jgi:serine/threonine protein kinase